MKNYELISCIEKLQNNIYSELNNFSRMNSKLGRLSSIIVAPLDEMLEVVKSVGRVIDNVAGVAINLVGSVFLQKDCRLKDALYHMQNIFSSVVFIPTELCAAPIKVIYQLAAIIINPQEVRSISYSEPTFKSNPGFQGYRGIK